MTSETIDRAASAAEPVLERLVREVHGLSVIQISTSDGYVVAGRTPDRMQAKKLAAMSASLVALAESLSRELDTGQPENLVIEAAEGIIVGLRISKHLLLLASVRPGTRLGALLSQTKNAAEEIREALSQ
ncbi:MAG TPA: roadblock/LC7 domain-containing protein [Arenicellales bacterium]|nr:roadblock/LC7 domain-containing protein [Arenicellales bacterium]